MQLDKTMKDAQGNQWSRCSATTRLQVGDHIILGGDGLSPTMIGKVGIVTVAPGGRVKNPRISVPMVACDKIYACPMHFIEYHRPGTGEIPDNIKIPHLSKGQWVAYDNSVALQHGQAVKIYSRRAQLNNAIGFVSRVKVKKAAIQINGELWNIPLSHIMEYQKME